MALKTQENSNIH